MQEACLRVGRRGGPWKAAYLFRVMRNAFIDQMRRSAKVRFTDDVSDVT